MQRVSQNRLMNRLLLTVMGELHLHQTKRAPAAWHIDYGTELRVIHFKRNFKLLLKHFFSQR